MDDKIILRKEPIISTSVGLFFILSILIGFSLYWNISNLHQDTIRFAESEARTNWDKDQAIRGWATKHGGVYVKPDKRTPPSPYMTHIPERDVVTTDGMKLTLMNPAYMMSQMTKEYEDSYGVKGKITALRLLNPGNRPDPWENKALKLFEQGLSEYIETTTIEEEPYVRYMKPMVIQKGCLKCHTNQGYTVGDIGGGVSVSIPLKTYLSAEEDTKRSIQITHILVWFLSTTALIAYGWYASKRQEARNQLQRHIQHQNVILAEAEEHARLLLESAGEGIIGLNILGEITFTNPAALRILGYSADELIGQSFHTTLQHSHEDGKPYPESESLIHTVHFNAKRVDASNEIMWKKDGTYLPVEFNATPIFRNKKLSGAVVTFSDISERLRTEQLKNEFISTISHELRTPLTAIRGPIDIVVNGVCGELTDQAQEMLKIASNNTERLLALINDLLDVQKMESGKLELRNEKLQISTLVKQVVKDHAGLAKQYNVSFIITQELPETCIYADKIRLTQVISNLLSNAAKFSRDSGKIEIATTKQNEYVQIAITDHGMGIAKEFQHKLFERFSQVDSSDTRSIGGTGLGLNIVKSITEMLNGCISFESTPGEGSTFYIQIPILNELKDNKHP